MYNNLLVNTDTCLPTNVHMRTRSHPLVRSLSRVGARVLLQIAEGRKELHTAVLVTLECLASVQTLMGLQSEPM